MTKIRKAPETMNGRKRTILTFQHEKTDRVSIGYSANPSIEQKLMKELGVSNGEELRQALGVDYRGLYPRYTGPNLFKEVKDRHVDQLSGAITKRIENENGYYWDYCDFPLENATDDDYETFPIPNPDHFDYDACYEQIKAAHGELAFHAHVGPEIINSNGMIMGMENVLCALYTEDEAAIDFINRRIDYEFGMLERLLSKCKGLVDFVFMGEDLGTQIGPLISLEMYRKYFSPVHKRYADLANAYHIPTIIHSCGSSSWAFEDFISEGIKGVDTLQPEAANMAPQYLVDHFGGRLCFRGCISTAGPLAYGTVDEVIQNCRETLEIMMYPYHGYHFAPTHCIQDNSPVENVIAMYQTAHDYGRYR